MDPLKLGAAGWEGLLSLEFILSLGVLLFVTVTLIALCTECGRYSFQLQQTPITEKMSSKLIKVVNLKDTAEGRENVHTADITKDEKGSEISVIPNKKLASQTASSISVENTVNTNGEMSSLPQKHVSTGLVKSPEKNQGSPGVSGPSEIVLNLQRECSFSQSWKQVLIDPQSSTRSLRRSQHAHESIQELDREAPEMSVPGRASPEDQYENSTNQIIEELKPQSDATNHFFDLQLREQSVETVPPIKIEGRWDDMISGELNNTYARVSKKIMTTSPPPQSSQPSEEEDEQAPPVPDRRFEM